MESTSESTSKKPSSQDKLVREKLKNLPGGPGVYLFLNKAGKVIYIGKAKSLKNRVRTYFQSKGSRETKTARLMSLIADLEIIVTDNEMEALILEANLVKEHKPRYNIALKDDKHYPYIKVTVQEAFPRIVVVRKIDNDGAKYFGPYTSAMSMRRTIRFISRLLKIRSCDLVIPHPKGRKYKVCLDYRIGRCGGPCEDFQSVESYQESVDALLLFLSGKGNKLVRDLEAKMSEAAELSEYERAAELRDQIAGIKTITERQKVDSGENVDRDIVALAYDESEREAVAVVLQIREGAMIGRQDIRIKPGELATSEEVLREFLSQYYNHQPNLPEQVYLPFALPDESLIADWLSEQRGKKVKVASPQRGEKLRLVEMAASNARLLLGEVLVQKHGYREKIAPMVSSLQKELSLKKAPNSICCFDISNTGETDAVGSMSYFRKGKPLKREYRKFKIKGVTGQDDFAMMREIIGRYFFRLKEEKKEFPDLVVVDGGKGQLNTAVKELKSLGIENQLIIGLAKRLEEVYFPDHSEPITIPKAAPALALLKQVRDEAHRFGVKYNLAIRKKRTITSKLDEIPGIGPAKRAALLKKFGSVKQIGEASIMELAETSGVSTTLAEQIKASLATS